MAYDNNTAVMSHPRPGNIKMPKDTRSRRVPNKRRAMDQLGALTKLERYEEKSGSVELRVMIERKTVDGQEVICYRLEKGYGMPADQKEMVTDKEVFMEYLGNAVEGITKAIS